MRLTKKRADNGRYYLSGLAEVSNSYPKGYGRIQVGHAVDKPAEYEDLEEQNRLIKLPCAVGDTVYEICEGFIEPCTVETIFLADYKDKAGNPSYMMEIYYDREDCPWVSTEIYFTDIGKTVFLTREEAEAALKELERGKGE